MLRNGMSTTVTPDCAARISLLCAPVACAAFIVLYIIAASEDPEYVIFESYLSDLGVGHGAWAFNAGAVVAGCMLAIFAIGGVRSYFGAGSLLRAGSMLLALSGVFLACVGVFTEDAGDAHLFVSYAFFISAFLSLAVLATGRLVAVGSLSDPFVLISITCFLVGAVAVGVSGPDPFAETIAVFALLAWGFIMPAAIAVDQRRGLTG